MTALVLFFVLIIFPIYHYGRIFKYAHKGMKETRETGTVVENPKLLKMSLGKVSSGTVSLPSTEGTFEFTSPNLCDGRAGDEIEVLYYGKNYDGIILYKEKKSDDRYSIIMIVSALFMLLLAINPFG